jgi:hypothetical protein
MVGDTVKRNRCHRTISYFQYDPSSSVQAEAILLGHGAAVQQQYSSPRPWSY